MKKIFGLLITLFLLNGCAESVALLGSSVGGASKGRILQSSANTAISLGVKQRTGKSPLEHAIAYAEEKNSEKKEPCLSFLEKTNSELCSIVKKQMSLTKSKILNKRRNKPLKDLTSSLQPNIDRSSKIKYLD
ncbi:hypothetical protein OAY20_02105 [Candidatus Pelagibacter bacterium]|nr:hypothetical protein [Candidatus Pelagibacter bacterium]